MLKLRCTCSANFVKIHQAVFEIPRTEDFFTKNLKTSIKWTILNFKKIQKHFSNIVFAYIAHAKFQKASFNSNRDIRQNIRGDGRYGEDPETIPPAVFNNGREVKKSKFVL